MSKAWNSYDQTQKNSIFQYLGVSHSSIGILAACIDLMVIVGSSTASNYLDKLLFQQGDAVTGAQISVDPITGVIFVAVYRNLKLYWPAYLPDPIKNNGRQLAPWSFSILLLKASAALLQASGPCCGNRILLSLSSPRLL